MVLGRFSFSLNSLLNPMIKGHRHPSPPAVELPFSITASDQSHWLGACCGIPRSCPSVRIRVLVMGGSEPNYMGYYLRGGGTLVG